MEPAAPRQRIDKWLWFARLAKTRTQAQAIITSGAVRINRQKIDAASHIVRVGDTLTIAVHASVRVLRVLQTGERRGPATEARLLYEELAPAIAASPATRPISTHSRRPDKHERRAITAMKRGDLAGRE